LGGRSAAASDVEGCAADGLTASQLPPISGFRSATSRDGRWLSGLVASVAAVGAVSGLVALLEPHLPALSLERYEPDGSVTGVAAWGRVPVELAVGTRFDLDGLSIAGGSSRWAGRSEGGLGPARRTLARRSPVPVQLQVGWRGGCPSRSR
jgi:hypothetical protein